MIAMNFIMSRQAMWLEAIERRISATSSMLSSMRGVKICGLRDTLLASLQKLRTDELRISKRFRKLIIWNMVFGESLSLSLSLSSRRHVKVQADSRSTAAYVTQVFAPVLTFAVFSTRARDSGDRTLDTARVFTSLSLFALLAEPLSSLVMALATFLGAVGSFARIQQFLESDERADTRTLPLVEVTGADEKTPEDAIAIRDGAFGWDPAQPPLLTGVTLSVPWRGLTMVVGPVGCGKSTLLQAMLGELPTLAGSVRLGSASVAYCAQDPWHMNGTVRDTILAGTAFDAKWYARVVRACALQPDFRQLPMGDATRIGSAGIALSGGQSQRLVGSSPIPQSFEACSSLMLTPVTS